MHAQPGGDGPRAVQLMPALPHLADRGVEADHCHDARVVVRKGRARLARHWDRTPRLRDQEARRELRGLVGEPRAPALPWTGPGASLASGSGSAAKLELTFL